MASINFYKMNLSRFESNEKHLSKFDQIENHCYFNRCYSQNIFVVMQSKSNSLPFKSNLLSLGILLELLGLQRFLLTKNLKLNFCKASYLKNTLRSTKFFIFLEFCLNSIFLGKINSFIIDFNKLNSKFHFFLPLKVINNLSFLVNTNLQLIFSISSNQNNQFEHNNWIPLSYKLGE